MLRYFSGRPIRPELPVRPSGKGKTAAEFSGGKPNRTGLSVEFFWNIWNSLRDFLFLRNDRKIAVPFAFSHYSRAL